MTTTNLFANASITAVGKVYFVTDNGDQYFMEQLGDSTHVLPSIFNTSNEWQAVRLPYYYLDDGTKVVHGFAAQPGFARAEYLPYHYFTWDRELEVVHDAYYVGTITTSKGVLGIKVPIYQQAVELPPVGCKACAYYTGEACLPCAVNPLQFPDWGDCRDYEALDN